MLQVYPNFFTKEEVSRLVAVFDKDAVQAVPIDYSKDVVACPNRQFPFGKRLAQFGRQLYNELLFYPTGAYSYPHIDIGPQDHSTPWARTALINCTDEYEGGELYFPNLKLEMKLPVGTILVFPAGNYEMYMHGVREIKSGSRMTAVVRFGTEV
jgi:hypothetical protein